MQSVPITTNVVSSNPAHCEVYSIQHYVIKFVIKMIMIMNTIVFFFINTNMIMNTIVFFFINTNMIMNTIVFFFINTNMIMNTKTQHNMCWTPLYGDKHK
jgi:hypothetical protein